ALRNVEPHPRNAGSAGDLRGRQPVELCVAGGNPSDDVGRCGAWRCEGWMEIRDGAYRFQLCRVRRERLPELQSLAARPRESRVWLHDEDDRRAVEEAARLQADDVLARSGGHAPAWRVRRLMFRDGAGT